MLTERAASRRSAGADRRRSPPPGHGSAASDRAVRARGRDTVARLLAAGLAEFDERGYQAVTVDGIVRRARASHGTFYLYFANKEDFFGALSREALLAMEGITDEFPVVTSNDAGRAALRTWVSAFCDTYAAHAVVIRILSQADLVGQDAWAHGLKLLFRLADVVSVGMTAAATPEQDGGARLSASQAQLNAVGLPRHAGTIQLLAQLRYTAAQG